MKKHLLLFILLLTMFSTQAQIVFCPDGAVWKSIHTRSWPDQTLETENVVFTGTQVVNGETVKVLTHRRFFLDINDFNVTTTYLKQSGDTVFFKNGYTQNNWQILYNFAAQVGQSWYNTLTNHGAWTYTITVTSTQTVSLLGQTLKQLSVTQHNIAPGFRNNFSYNITERLGSNMFVFTFGGESATDGDNWMENLCYTDNGFGTYHYSSKSCDYTILLGVKEQVNSMNGISLYPNPVSNSLMLHFENRSENVYQYSICNALGQKLAAGELNSNVDEAKITTGDLSEGVYFISLRDLSTQKESTQRFVKTN